MAFPSAQLSLGRGRALDPVVDALRDRLGDRFRRRVPGRPERPDVVRERPVSELDLVCVEGLALLAGLLEPLRRHEPANALRGGDSIHLELADRDGTFPRTGLPAVIVVPVDSVARALLGLELEDAHDDVRVAPRVLPVAPGQEPRADDRADESGLG